MKKTAGMFTLALALSTAAHASNIGISTSWTTAANNGGFADTVVGDSVLSLTASANGQVSGAESDGSEWDIRQSVDPVGTSDQGTSSNAASAVSVGTYIDFTMDSAGFNSDLFSLNQISVSFWRNGAQAPDYFQLACSDDADWTTDDLLGTALNVTDTTAQIIASSAAALPESTTTAAFRLYYWDTDATRNGSANFHLTDVSAVYSADTVDSDPDDGEEAPRPNIVLIFMDDMGYNDIGVQAYPSPTNYYPNAGPEPALNGYTDADIPEPNQARLLTPTIDSIADDGMRMTSFHTARLCSPSRAKLMTGRYASRMNMDRVFNPGKTTGFSTREVTLPEQLRELGYATGMIGKWHLGYNPDQAQPFQMMPTRNGFQEFYGTPHSNDMDDYALIQDETVLIEDMGEGESYQTKLTWQFTEAALDFMERKTAVDQPFFLYFAHAMTHIPCWPSNQEFTNADGTTWPMFKGSSGVSYYYDVVKEVDHSVDRVLTKLDDLGIADDTIVIFASDNGPWLSLSSIDLLDDSVGCAYPLKDGKFTTWEGGCRVPFLIRWPGQIEAGSVSDQVGGLIDLLPTLVPLAGGEAPTDRTIDGIDLWPVWSGETNGIDRMYALFNDGTAEGVLKGGWKLRDGALYDLDNDIQEEIDVSSNEANASVLAELEDFKSSIETSASTDVEPLGVFTDYEVELSTNDLQVSEGGTATVNICLSHNPGSNVTVGVSHFSGDDDLYVSSGSSLSFTTSDWSEWQTVTLGAAHDADDDHDGATFRVTTSGHDFVRELFVFEVDDEAAADASASLVWPKVQELTVSNRTVKLVAEGSVLVGTETDPEGAVYSWKKVSGPGEVEFTDSAANRTGVSFSTNGTYELRFTADHTNAGAFGAVDITANVGAAEESSAVRVYKYGPTFAYDAATDDDGDAVWENDVASGTQDWTLDSDITRTADDSAANLSFIDVAYDFPGGTSPDGGTTSSFDSYSTGDASLEFWFAPDSLPVSSPQVLWESGGDVGAGFVLEGSQIRFAVDGSSSGAIAEATLAPSADRDGFVHCVGVIDLTNEEIALYLDGALADTASISGVTDWCGVSGTGLGTISDKTGESTDFEHIGGNDLLSETYGTFAGQIAWVLFYDYALGAAEVAELLSGPVTVSNAQESAVNVGPVVSAGSDQSLTYTLGVELAGSVQDDGLPSNSVLNVLWRKASGPGDVSFTDEAGAGTAVDFDAAGAYELWLEADDGEIKVYDEVSITVDSLTYSEWAAVAGLSEGEDSASDNPDGDSFNNYWEWVLGLDPAAFDLPISSGVVSASKTSDAVTFTFSFEIPRDRTPDLGLEISEDLSRWTEAAGLTPEIEVLDSDTCRWTYALEVDTDSQTKLFARPVGYTE